MAIKMYVKLMTCVTLQSSIAVALLIQMVPTYADRIRFSEVIAMYLGRSSKSAVPALPVSPTAMLESQSITKQENNSTRSGDLAGSPKSEEYKGLGLLCHMALCSYRDFGRCVHE